MTETTPEPTDRRTAIKQTALRQARQRHTPCPDYDPATATIDGTHTVYCRTCGQILLEWGGDDAN